MGHIKKRVGNPKLLSMKTRPCFLLLLSSLPVKSFSSSSRKAFFASDTRTTLSTSMLPNEERSGQTSAVWDHFAKGYKKQPIKDEAAYKKKLEITQSYLKPDMNVLEFGCGTGATSIIHAPYVKKILAVDISEKMVEICKQSAQEANVKNVEFRQASVDTLDLPNESQDVVLGLSILHLLKNKDEAIAKTHRWLKPNGLFVTSTTCVGDLGATTKFFMNTVMPLGQFFGFLPHINKGLTKTELKDSLTGAGFKIEHEWQPKEDAAVFIIGRKI